MLNKRTAPMALARARLLDYMKSLPREPELRLPPERELHVRLGVSLSALRKAIKGLASEGRISIVPREGNFVSFSQCGIKLALVVRDVSIKSVNLGDMELARSLFATLEKEDCSLNIVQAPKASEIPELLKSYGFDGALVLGGSSFKEFAEVVSRIEIPCAGFTLSSGARIPHCVSFDHAACGVLRAKFMLARGHKAIACMTPKDSDTLAAFYETLRAAGVEPPRAPSWDFERDEIQRKAALLLDKSPVTAFCLDGDLRFQEQFLRILESHPRCGEVEVLLDYCKASSLALPKLHPKTKIAGFCKAPCAKIATVAAEALLESVKTGRPVESLSLKPVVLRPDGSEIPEKEVWGYEA